MRFLRDRVQYAVQLAATLAAIAFIPSNIATAVALLAVWAATFRRATGREVALFAIACLFFSVMNVMSLRNGIFLFERPDLLGMPYYEYLMWGFYLLHTIRVVDGPAPEGRLLPVVGLAVLYGAAFGGIADAGPLLVVTALLLAIGLALYHEPYDLAYAGYMVLLGAAIEYTGVGSGQWSYPDPPIGGVPLWFVTLWGGVGLFLRRLVIPLLRLYPKANPAPGG